MVWVGESSEAVAKSMSSRFLNSLTDLGAEEVGAVQTRTEWTFTWPVNLHDGRLLAERYIRRQEEGRAG